MQGKHYVVGAERGVSLTGLIAVLAVLGVLAVLALKVVPTWAEYRSIQDGIEKAKANGGTVREMLATYDKNASINNVTAVRARDLVVTRDGGETEFSFAYEKRVPLAGNVSLVIDYAGTTDPSGVVASRAHEAE